MYSVKPLHQVYTYILTMYMYQWVLEVYFRMGREKRLTLGQPYTYIRLQAQKSCIPSHLKITQKVTLEQNIPVWRATVLVSFYQDVDGLWVVVNVPNSKCVVGLSISFWLYCLLKSLWFEQLQWCFYVICLYFAWDERHFFYCFDARGRKERSVVIETSDVF